MAYEHVTLTLPGLVAGADLTSSQFLIGKLASTAGQVVLAGDGTTTTALTTVYGVIMNKPYTGEEVEFAVAGVAKVKACSTAIAIGDWVGPNSTSQAEKTVTTDDTVIGRALEAASAANDVISVLLVGGHGRL